MLVFIERAENKVELSLYCLILQLYICVCMIYVNKFKFHSLSLIMTSEWPSTSVSCSARSWWVLGTLWSLRSDERGSLPRSRTSTLRSWFSSGSWESASRRLRSQLLGISWWAPPAWTRLMLATDMFCHTSWMRLAPKPELKPMRLGSIYRTKHRQTLHLPLFPPCRRKWTAWSAFSS